MLNIFLTFFKNIIGLFVRGVLGGMKHTLRCVIEDIFRNKKFDIAYNLLGGLIFFFTILCF